MPEATAHFEAVVKGFENVKRAAQIMLKTAESFRERPDERALLEELASSNPDYVAEAKYQWGVTLQQQGQFASALDKLVQFAQQNSKSPFVSDAVLRQGICRVELKQFADAARTLASLGDHPTLGEQATWWLGKAHAGMADPNNPKSLEPAISTLQKAAEKARQAKDPEAKMRRGQILLDIGENQQVAKQFKEAAATYQTLLLEKPGEELNEAALGKLALALGLAGQLAESDKICAEFSQKFPRSPSTGMVMFRSAENAFHSKKLADAAQRYGVVVNKYPEFGQINAARKGMGTALYELGKYEEAATALQQVPNNERVGEMAGVSYLLAECLIKTMPADADDALATARLVDQIEQASALLNAFVAAQENHPEVPGALLKIGAMRQRAASVLADADEKKKNLIEARDAYVKVVQRFPNHPQFATAVLENAKVAAQTGDYATAINQLNRFQAAPLNGVSIAPLALIRLGEFLRIQKRAPEAVNLLTAVRTQHAQALMNDPARSAWLPTLNYQLGLALKDAGKFADARAAFDQLSKTFPNSPEALEASWRVGQSQREEAVAKLDGARKAMSAAGGDATKIASAQALVDSSSKAVKDAANYLTAQAAKAEKDPQIKLRLMHEMALCYRSLAEAEFEMAREKLQREALTKRQAALAADLPKGRPLPALKTPEIAASAVPAQPDEAVAKEKYQAVIAAGADTPFAIEARVELAELLAKRGDWDGALKLLSDAVKEDGPADQIDKIRMRLGELALAKGDTGTARTQYDQIAANQKSPYFHHAKVGLGECFAVEKKWPQVVETMLVYRTTPELKRLPEVADRAMLRLAQAYGQLGQWEPSRLAIDAFNRYHPNSPLMPEAKFTMSLALQHLHQLD
ncbi:MAG TPA: tetratricopeptide repeat protein, partial [Tepidisphaeraceae bacterium]|nr:tetratricopeptide repeat protein [Tepidisphaeraceae bacterium]